MTFRTSDKLQRYEMVTVDSLLIILLNNLETTIFNQKKTGYKFTITFRQICTLFDYFQRIF